MTLHIPLWVALVVGILVVAFVYAWKDEQRNLGYSSGLGGCIIVLVGVIAALAICVLHLLGWM